MALEPIKLPPGFRQSGTPYQAKGRWLTGDRVRWHDGLLRPIGGWMQTVKTDGTTQPVLSATPADQKFRAMHTWRDLDLDVQTVFGHNEGLLSLEADGTTVDITPAGWVDKSAEPTGNLGYGGWFYGSGSYGTARPAPSPEQLKVFNWCFRNWGEDLIAFPRWPADSVIYDWTPGDLTAAALGGSAPTGFNCGHVTPERIMMVGGTATSPRTIQWCDQEDHSTWTPAATNQAGSYLLEGEGRILEMNTVLGNVLIVTETDAHRARYLGPPYVYGFDRVGTNCGAVSGAAVVTTDRFAVWPSKRGFYLYDGTIRRLECDVIDEISGSLESLHAGKMVGFTIAAFTEVWWLYQDAASDIDSYICWDWSEDHWTIGTLDRTIGHDEVAGLPVRMVRGATARLFDHELEGVLAGTSADEIYAETAPLEIGNGDQIMMIGEAIPDFEVSGTVDITFYGQSMPGGPELTYGPYSIDYPRTTDQPIPMRASGRNLRMRVTGSASTWALGTMRLNVMPGGGR